MDQSQPSMLLPLLLGCWGVVTAVLVVLLIYRATLSAKEDDQVFVGSTAKVHYQEQQAVIAKLSRLSGPIIVLAVLSGVLLLTSAGIWIYRGLAGS